MKNPSFSIPIILSHYLIFIITEVSEKYLNIVLLNYGFRVFTYLLYLIEMNGFYFMTQDYNEEKYIIFNAVVVGCLILMNIGLISKSF